MARGCGCGCISWLAFELWLSSAVTWLMRVSAINICYVCIARKTLATEICQRPGKLCTWLDFEPPPPATPPTHINMRVQYSKNECSANWFDLHIKLISMHLAHSLSLSLVLFLLWQWPGNILNKWVISDIKCLVNCAEYSVHIHTTHKNINSHSIYMYSSG